MAEEQLDMWRMDGKASMLWTWRVTPGHTGRTIQGDDGSALAADWAKLSNRDEMIAHPACQKFRDEVSESRLVPGISLLCFRRRDFGNVRPTWDSMGPPPDCDAKGGRYNKPGHAVLYLCDSEWGVREERRYWHKEGGVWVPYVQRYSLPIDRLSIADFSDLPADSFVAAVFSKAEECGVSGYGINNYTLSQIVAELVSEKFDGMRVPGARGQRDRWYNNIIVFRPHPNWRTWVETDSAPYPLVMR